MTSQFSKLLHDYSDSFNLSNVAELSRKLNFQEDGITAQGEKQKFTVMYSHSTQNFEFGHFTL